jgi:hypothetical protein
MDHKALPVKGYAETQSQEKIDLVNEGKELEERALRYFEKIATRDDLAVNGRWFSIAKTHIQQGFMASTRAIFNSQRIKLPEDE